MSQQSAIVGRPVNVINLHNWIMSAHQLIPPLTSRAATGDGDADTDFAVGADIDAVGGDVVVEDAQLQHGVFGACCGGGIPCRFLHPAEALEFGAAEFDADIDAVGG